MQPGLMRWSVAGACTVVVFIGWTALEIGGPGLSRAFDDVTLLLAAGAAGISCLGRAPVSGGRDRKGWLLLGASCVAWAAGQLTWTVYQQVFDRVTPFPSPADAGFVVAMPLAGWAILQFGWTRGGVPRVRSVIDAFLIAGSIGCLTWVLLLERVWNADYDTALAAVVAAAYPLGTALNGCLVVAVLGRSRRNRAALLLIGAGILTLAATDTAYAYLLAKGHYETGHPIDAGWLVGFIVIALAALVPSTQGDDSTDPDGQPLWSTLVPYAPVTGIAIVIGATAASEGRLHPVVVSGSIGLAALVLVRHCLTIIEHKTLEAALRATTRELTEAQELTHIGTWAWDVAAGVSTFSDELCRIHGIAPGSPIVFEEYRRMVHPDDLAGFEAASAAVSEGGGPIDLEYRFLRSDGSLRWLRGRSSSNGKRSNRAPRVYGTIEDITERKHAEDALRFQAGLLQAVGQAVVATDPGGQVTYWNHAAEVLYGWRAGEVLGRNILDIVPTDMASKGAEIMASLAAGETWCGEFWMQHRDGSRFPAYVSDTPVFDDAGNLVAIIGTSTDVSERRRAEDLLRASEERYRQLVESSPLAIVDLDPAGVVRLCNQAAHAVFGSTDGRDRLDVSQHTELREVLDRVMGGERITDHEMWVERRGQPPAHLEVAAGALQSAAGQPIGAIVVAADVTHRKSLESRLLQAQKLEAVGRLAGGIAHDFNNLLTIVLGHTHLLLQRADDDAEVQAGLEAIKAGAERGATLTSRLLTFSRTRLPARSVVDLNEAVRSVCDLLLRTLGEDIAIEASTQPGVGCVTVERSELDQVLLNLAVNARDAMPDGGTLGITTSKMTVDGAAGTLWSGIGRGDYAVVTVTDTGTGMDGQTLENCLEPFFTTKPQGKGTGLGLATVYGIVSGAGGHIRVDSAPGKGTTFTILIPAVSAPTEVKRETSGSAGGAESGAPRTVLIVEDEDDVRTVATRLLEAEGYRVLSASNGARALALVDDVLNAVDVVVTDVVMPELGGIELARELLSRRRDLDVVFMSGYTDRVLPDLRTGHKPWLVEKPFAPGVLADTVREVLRAAEERSIGADGGSICVSAG